VKNYFQGRKDGGQGGHNSSGAESLSGRQMTATAPKSPNNVTSTFFSTEHLVLKDLRFEHGDAKLTYCPRRHLTSLRPWFFRLYFDFPNSGFSSEGLSVGWRIYEQNYWS